MHLAETCHLHFWQNDLDLLRVTAVAWGKNRYPNENQHRKLTLKKKILPPILLEFQTQDLLVTSLSLSHPHSHSRASGRDHGSLVYSSQVRLVQQAKNGTPLARGTACV